MREGPRSANVQHPPSSEVTARHGSGSHSRPFHRVPHNSLTPEKKMTSPDQERWLRVKEKLRAEVGEDIFQSWFARMDLERIEVNTAHLSVPTRFLKSWIQSHYTDRVLACWQSENADVQKIEVSVRSAVIRPAPPKLKSPEM